MFEKVKSIINKFNVNQKGIAPLKDDSYLWRTLRQQGESGQEITRPYSQSVWVYSSLHTIAQNIARVPFRIYNEGANNTKTKTESGAISNLFTNPNPYITGEQLFEATLIHLGLSGEAFWILDGMSKPGSLPTEIWTFDPCRFTPIFDSKSQMVIGWTYRGSKVMTFDNSEIIHFKYYNPYDDIRGLSPLAAVKMGIDQDYYASRYNKSFFKEGATLSGFLTSDRQLSEDQYKRLLNQFEQRHKGGGRAHKIGILEGGMKFEESKINQRDMEFVKLKKLTREEIFAAFKVNSVVLGLYEDVKSYEGIKSAHKAFWQECLIPKIKYIEGVLWSKLFSGMNGGKTWGEFDLAGVEALQDDFKSKVSIAKDLQSMGFPINSINRRLDLGMEEVAWGNSSGKPSDVTPSNNPEKKNMISDSMTIKTIDDEVNITEKFRPFLDNYLSVQIPLERSFKKKLDRYLFEVRKDILEGILGLNGQEFNADRLISSIDHKKLITMLCPIYEEAYAKGIGTLEFDQLQLKSDLQAESKELVNSRLVSIPRKIAGLLKKHIESAINEAGINSESGNNGDNQAIAGLLRDVFNSATAKTLSIARTETASVMSMARFTGMKNASVKRHMWVANMDGKERKSHKSLNGATTTIGEPFEDKDGFISALRYPGDSQAPTSEIINCRCITVAVL